MLPSEPVEGEAIGLSDVAPREQVGSETLRRFDYQFLQAAGACLDMLSVTDGGESVFCEWHDDYVVEHAGGSCALYAFYQVKTKKLALGAWSLNELFGVNIKKPAAPAVDAIAAHLLEHYAAFSEQCVQVTFVTNAAVADALHEFLAAVRQAQGPASLGAKERKTFDALFTCYRELGAFVTEGLFFGFLRTLRFIDQVGTINPRTFDSNYQLLTSRILELSEILLRHEQALAITMDLVALVKRKSVSHLSLPVEEEKLRTARAVAPADVLRVLALSPEGYRTLRENGVNGRDAVRALSRLQRLCEASGVPTHVVPSICGLKSRWDLWERKYGQLLSGADGIELRAACDALVNRHADGDLGFPELSAECEAIAAKLGARILSVEPLDRELVVGCVFSIASTRAA